MITEQDECTEESETLFAPAWDEQEQLWAAPCSNDNADDSQCKLVKDDTLEIESTKLSGSICRQGP